MLYLDFKLIIKRDHKIVYNSSVSYTHSPSVCQRSRSDRVTQTISFLKSNDIALWSPRDSQFEILHMKSKTELVTRYNFRRPQSLRILLDTRGRDHLSSQAEAEDCGSCIIGAHPSPSLPLANLCDNQTSTNLNCSIIFNS